MIKEVTDLEFDRVVEGATVPVLVLFWKPGCGGCRALTRVLERLQKEVQEKASFLKMNVEEQHQIPAELEINSLPALALYREGLFARFIGGMGTKEEILRQLALP
ncbi:MAG TPA: thioredoxin domain-containing protein [Nitrospira sp.]